MKIERPERMTNELHRKINAELKRMIGNPAVMIKVRKHRVKHQRQISEALQRSIVLPLGSTRAPKSSALVPVPENPPVWVVGSFGSVWCDIKIEGEVLRVGYDYDGGFIVWEDEQPDEDGDAIIIDEAHL